MCKNGVVGDMVTHNPAGTGLHQARDQHVVKGSDHYHQYRTYCLNDSHLLIWCKPFTMTLHSSITPFRHLHHQTSRVRKQ